MAKVNVMHQARQLGFGFGIGLILLVVGLFWLSKDMGWIKTDLSFWPVLLVVLGAYWAIKALFFRRYY